MADDAQRTAAEAPHVWLIRAGENGQAEKLALRDGYAVIGWTRLGPLAAGMTREQIETRIRDAHSERRLKNLAAQVGELYRFVNEIEIGDLVVLPLRTRPRQVALGRIDGPYESLNDQQFVEADAANARAVDWLTRGAPYELFDADLQRIFSRQDGMTTIEAPQAAERLQAGLSPIGLIVKWSAHFGADTVDQHRDLAERHGAVWWGLRGSPDKPKLTLRWVARIKEQLEDSGGSIQTRVFLSGPSCWSTSLEGIALRREEVEEELIPAHDAADEERGLWVKLSNFQQIQRDSLLEQLELVSAPGVKLASGALGNQTNPLIVRRWGTARLRTHDRSASEVTVGAPFEVATQPAIRDPPLEFVPDYVEPSFPAILGALSTAGLRMEEQTVRRYHVSLKTRGFVVLSGLSGSGKTWLAQLYADAVDARSLLVSVAPNWTANEDLLGYYDPLSQDYRHTPFSLFLEQAASAWRAAEQAGVRARPYHLILDEMNLARVEYYFAKFLSAMEVRARNGSVPLDLDSQISAELTPNLSFIGTINVDETTQGFADKIYDRAQLIEIAVHEQDIRAHLTESPYGAELLEVWEAMREVAPFAYRVLDEVGRYVAEAQRLGVAVEAALDEQLLQKVLPKVSGTDKRIGPALRDLIALAEDRWPLCRGKATQMLGAFEAHGFTSFF